MAHSCKLALVAYSDTGLVRERNEDQVLLYNLDDGEVLEHDQVVDLQLGPRGALACVFDGMGGAASGDVASKLASDVVRQVVGAATIATRQDLAESLGEAVVTAHRRIREYGAQHGESRGLGTTFTGAAIYDNSLVVAHVGDSRAYLLRRGALVQLTEDQSLLQELVTAGRLRPEEASEYEHSNVILQALGVNQRVFPVIGWLPLQDGDRIVLCSDGLSDLVAFEELYELLDDEDIPQQQVGVSLIEAAKTNGGHDNISVVLVDVLSGASQTEGITAELTPIEVESAPASVPKTKQQSELALLLVLLLLLLLVAALIIVVGS
jgi:serine/threonine protein phosphatase PrpC